MDNDHSAQFFIGAGLLFLIAAALVFLFKNKLVSKHNLLQGSISRGIIGFTIPLLVGGFFQQFYTTVDTIMLGQFVGSHAVGAIGPSGMIFFLVLSVMIGFTAGGGILIAHYFGAKDFISLKKGIDTFYITILIGAIIITIVGIIITPISLRLVDLPAELLPDAEAYLKILFLSSIFAFGYNGIASILRSIGDSITPLIFLIISTAINIVFDYIFIYLFQWGVAGAAWATVIAQAGSFVMALMYMGRQTSEHLHLHIHKLNFDKEIFSKMVKMGLPASIQQTVISFSLVLLSKLVNKHGASYTNAYSAIQRLDSFIILPGMNFMLTISTFVGQNIGAKQFDRLKQGLITTLLIGVGFSSVVSLIIAMDPQLFLSFFLKDDLTATLIGVDYFSLTIWFYPVATAMFIFSGAIRGSGQAMVSMMISIFVSLVLRVPLAIFLENMLGASGIWWSFVVTWATGLLLNALYWMSGHWRKKSVILTSKSKLAGS
ncbi:MATE family efflux transporter [Entomospira nematocerorum]|uniref:Multidrug-efflux transporter n=1 Tax=Entomospira nematocerorum TaxID=2719987 RepID=A0A968GC90_9SPIO|nr:MATE family efflux transporter [Entomospira nematocera]NIZ46763.1 MATE family efflux transporter [Entomospira nematocera]WDI33440.1 MATE family efflux transporter [Entomospira nematocera]